MKTERDLLENLIERFDSAFPSEDTEHDRQPDGIPKNFERNRWFFALGATAFFFVVAWIFFTVNSMIFILPGGFFVMSLGYLVLLIYDRFTTHVDTFSLIGSNSVASALLILGLIGLVWLGVGLAKDYTPDSFRNEASGKAVPTQSNSQSNDTGQPETSEIDAQTYWNDGRTNR